MKAYLESQPWLLFLVCFLGMGGMSVEVRRQFMGVRPLLLLVLVLELRT